MNLSQAKQKHHFIIDTIKDAELLIKLLELGIFEGSRIELVQKAPAGGPLSIKNSSSHIILRKEDASCIDISPE
jgi:Fe2+ transport system protein FeoA